MAVEIERKFLLSNTDWEKLIEKALVIRQGYLSQEGSASVRIRIQNEQATINIKSMTLGIERMEYEYDIALSDAHEMLDTLVHQPIIEKTRYLVHYEGKCWEIDKFEGDNKGLLVAEIELDDVSEVFSMPPWIGREVSHLPRYYNVNLLNYPFCLWTNKEQFE